MVRAPASHARRRHRVEFVVGSRACSEGFSPGSPVFLPPQKPTLQILIQSGNEGHIFVSFAVKCYSRAVIGKISCFYCQNVANRPSNDFELTRFAFHLKPLHSRPFCVNLILTQTGT